MRKLLFLTITTIATLALMLVAGHSEKAIDQVYSSGGHRTWAVWWAPMSSPWVYDESTRIGGFKFMKYNNSTHHSLLEQEFNSLLAYHKPNVLVVYFNFQDIYPYKWTQDPSIPLLFPRGDNKVSDIVNINEPDFEYYDDLVDLARQNGIQVILRPNANAYGGFVTYPYTYYSSIGWFWCRPDWGPSNLTSEQKIAQGYCYADPRTEAMRHPTTAQNGSNYNWIEHTIAYGDVSRNPNARHFPLTSNGTEFEEGQPVQVYESPDMVFNGLDTDVGIHTPVPSFSSDYFLNFSKILVADTSEHFKDHVNVLGYMLWEEPSYAHLRENMIYTSGWGGISGRNYEIGEQTDYEVDYSAAELSKYNAWRGTRGEAPVSQIPFPANANYNTFKKNNLARFMNELAATVRANDPNTKVMVPFYHSVNIWLPEVDYHLMNQVVRPEIFGGEPSSMYDESLSNSGAWTTFANAVRSANPNLGIHLSGYTSGGGYEAFLSTVIPEFYRPGFVTNGRWGGANSVGDYPIWAQCVPAQNNCTILQQSVNNNSCIPDCVTRSCSQGNGCGGTCPACQGGGVTPAQVIEAYGNRSGPEDINEDGLVNGIDFVNSL